MLTICKNAWHLSSYIPFSQLTVCPSEPSNQAHSMHPEPEPNTVPVMSTKPKQWLANTINSLRSIGSLDLTTGSLSARAASEI